MKTITVNNASRQQLTLTLRDLTREEAIVAETRTCSECGTSRQIGYQELHTEDALRLVKFLQNNTSIYAWNAIREAINA